ncbi:MAG: hypothetical protein H7X99_09915 [Saprospiraceae bacterium]|nr:hypothetical protein [Saprospiraceae bacterium]
MHIDKYMRIMWLVLGVHFMTSCNSDADQLTPEEKYAVDTIYNKQVNALRSTLDSICQAQKDTLFVMAADSIKKERMEEIEMLLIKN